MQKRQVVLWLLVPADQQTAKAVHPRMCPFHHPPTRLETRFPLDRLRLFPARAHMSRKAELLQNRIHLIIIIALVQAHSLWVVLGRRRGSRQSRAPVSYHADWRLPPPRRSAPHAPPPGGSV